MTRIGAHLLVAAALVAGTALAQPEDAGLYLYQISSSRADGEPSDLSGTVRADLFVPDPAYLVEQLTANSGLTVVATTERYVRVSASDGVTLSREPTDGNLAATFVIDYEQPSVAKLARALTSEHGPGPSIDVLIEFVDGTITSKSYRRSFDLASQVARSGEGDCTEHAVLLAALARATGKPARVVLGVLLIAHDGSLLSFGHAWTEIHDGRDWRIADATRPDLQIPDAQVRHLPVLELRDEGPGYAMQLLELAMVQPTRIAQVQTVLPES